jgi:ABC-type multidrug transport system fused ATPase/permease subunit
MAWGNFFSYWYGVSETKPRVIEMNAIFFIREIFRKYPALLCANIMLLVVASLVEATSFFCVAPLVDFVINDDLHGGSPITQKVVAALTFIGFPITIASILIIFLALNVLRSGFQIGAMHLILRTKYAVLRDIMLGTFEDFFNARWYFFSSNVQGKLLNTFMREMAVVGDAFGGMARFFASILQMILFLGVPLYISWRVTLVSIVTGLMLSLPFMLFSKLSYRLGKLNTSTANKMGKIIQENLGSAKVILGFANQDKSKEMLSQAFDAHRSVSVKSQTLGLAIPLMYYPLGLVMLIIALFMTRLLAVPLSESAVLILSLMRVIPVIAQITGQKTVIDNFFPSYEQINDLRNYAKECEQKTGMRTFAGFKDIIKMDGVSFAYGSQEAVLTDVNVAIRQGKMTALVGGSGAGKSTFIDVLMGFNEPFTGRVFVDNIPLQEFDIKSYRKRIGYVPQESILFNMSIADNLRWANEAATEEEIKEACIQANAHEFIQEFPEGYNTLVGDRGVRLSGGQIQRVALARATLRKPDLLVLDEATSSLDTHSERLIQQAVDKIAKQTTVVVIAHRLSTIVNADCIYVFKDGRVIEKGGYSELVSKNGYFNSMTKLQALENAG